MAWVRDEPVASSALQSSPVRSNFQALDASNWGPNWVEDPSFIIWAGGDSAPPSCYGAVVGSGGSVSRNTTDYRANGMAMKVTLGSEDTYVPQTIFASGQLPAYFQGKDFSFACAVKTSTASLAKVGLYDGVGTTFTSGGGTNGTHTGGGGWEWLYGTRTLDANATQLEIRFYVDIAGTSGNATFDLAVLIPGPIPPQTFIPCPTNEGVLYFPVSSPSADTDIARFRSALPFIVRNVSLHAGTPPTGQSLDVDVNKWDGSAWQSMFGATKAEIAAANADGGGRDPDGTYEYRCFGRSSDNDSITDTLLNVDIDQIGSSEGGADLIILVRVLQFQSPARGLQAFF